MADSTTATIGETGVQGADIRDLVSIEIFARQLHSIAQEMGTTMIRTSGDPVIAEANDFSTVVTDAQGELLSGAYLTYHLGAARQTIRHLLDVIPAEDIHPGDAWICNDPHTTGACHAPDLGIVRPMFADGELIAWCWAEAHMMDIGGVAPGGFAPGAYECYAEGLRFPGVKIVSRGQIIDDIWRLITANFRVPDRNLNEIRCFIAACNTADARVAGLVAEHGVDGFRRLAEASKELTEGAARRRIGSLPDGTYMARDYVEHNGHVNDLYEIVCHATVQGEKLTFDFTGTTAQTDGFINVAHGSALSAVVTPLFMTLVPDVPINDGLIRALDFVFPRGTLVNPEMPAPTSSGHMETGLRVTKIVAKLLGQMQVASEEEYVRAHVMSPFFDAAPLPIYYAPNESGEWVPFLDLNAQGGGGGAQPHTDGIDAAGPTTVLDNKLPDLEVYEHQNPVLFLWRTLNLGSGGIGRQRGGNGVRVAWTPWRTPGGQITAVSACNQVPPAGLLGGYPSSGGGFRMTRGGRIDELLRSGKLPDSFDGLDGELIDLEPKTFLEPLPAGEIFEMHAGGGTGLGDPLQRDPEAVGRDVRDRYLQSELAKSAYGVVCGERGEVDAQATERARESMLEQRRAWPIAPSNGDGNREREFVAADAADERAFSCPSCASELAPAGADYRDHVPTRRRNAADALASLGSWSARREGVDLAEFACPSCGALLSVDVVVAADAVSLGDS
jgi:N-methylhydantoinase B